MHVETLTHYSPSLRREMRMRIYGRGGVPFLVFSTQSGNCRTLEDFGMIDQLDDFINGQRIQWFTVDSVDEESWMAQGGDNDVRAARQEQYYHYIIDEVVPLIHARNGNRLPVATGAGMGALHAAIVFLRRPELFSGVLALSGVYDTKVYFGDWINPTLYDNAPDHFLPGMPTDHRYINIYNQKKMIFCVGQGAWEDDGVRTLRTLEQLFGEKGIHAWCDFWGFDVNHDWPWWYKEMRYFLPILLRDL